MGMHFHRLFMCCYVGSITIWNLGDNFTTVLSFTSAYTVRSERGRKFDSLLVSGNCSD